MVFASVTALAQDEAVFDFQANPWGHALGSGSGETADAGNITEALLADDGATSISFNQGTAGTAARFWTGPQVRAYKGSTATIAAAEGKKITQVVVIATGASYLCLSNEEFTADGSTAVAKFDEPMESVTLSLNGTSRWTKIKVSYGEPTSSVDISNTPETAYTVTEATELIYKGEGLDKEVYVKGAIEAVTEISTTYGNATYTIVDGTNALVVYRGYDIDGAKFESEDALHAGDEVIVYGKLVNFNSTCEIAQGNKLHSLVCNYKGEQETDNVIVNVTYNAGNGTVVLAYPDYANGGVEPGNGTPEVWNEMIKVAELINGELGDGFNEVKYTLSTTLAPGTYTVKVPAGAVGGNKTDGWGAMSPIGYAEGRFEVTESVDPNAPVDIATLFGTPNVVVEGNNVKYTYPNTREYELVGQNVEKTLGENPTVTLQSANFEDLETVAIAYDNDSWSFLAKFTKDVQATIEAGGALVFSEGAWVINKFDENTGATLETYQSPVYVYTGEGGEGGNTGDGWTFASVTPAEGAVESIHEITFAYLADIMWVNESVTLPIVGDNGVSAQVMIYDNFAGACVGTVLDVTLSTSGKYTLTIPAGSFTDQVGNPNAAMTYTWTIGGSSDGGEDQGGEVSGTKWQENVFAQGTPVAIPLNINTNGVTITSVARDFMGTSIDVSYNMYEEGELDWKNGTQLVFTAKDNITGIVIDGQFKEFAGADKGTYVNGAWTGILKAGETLTLTANDGINIHSITILYNGAELKIDEDEETEATITFDITKTEWSKIGAENGESIGTVSCNLKNFDHYMFIITNDDDPAQVITFADLLSIEGDMKCFSPDANGYDLFNGQNYTLHIYAYDTPQYGAPAAAEAEYKFVGTGKAATIYNEEITVVGVSLKPNAQGLGYNLNGTQFDVTFSAPVASVNAWWAKGFEGATSFTAVKKTDDATVWTIIMDESVTTAEGAVNVNITAKDTNGNQLRCACDNTPYAIDVVVSPEEETSIASVTIGEQVIALSETEAVSLAEYPADAVISITNDDEAIKKVTYEIIDLTKNEIIKSQGDLTKGENGVWSAAMPKAYVLAAGHDYSIHVVARNGMSSFTSQIIYEYNFLLKGTTSVKDYSAIKLVSVSPTEKEIITDKEPVITFTFDAPIAQLTAAVNVSQGYAPAIAAANIASNDDKTVWTVKVPESYMSFDGIGGALSLNIAAVDANGDFVYDANNSVGTPESSYISFSWTTTVALPAPKLAENGKELEEVKSITFTYEGIGLNLDKSTAAWDKIVIAKDGKAINLAITEDMFAVGGDISNGGTELTLTFPSALAGGDYTVTVPAMAFMLGHDNSNYYNGDCEFTFTVKATAPELAINITKTDWSKIGSENGEVIGTAELKNADAFDHIEAEIRCAEDPDQYITFSNLMTNGGNLTCYCWEGGSYTLNKGYHYTITVKAFDVPFYGATPVATATYEFVGTGAEAIEYCDIKLASVGLKPNSLLLNGYDADGQTFDVTFSEPVSKVKAWMAMGFDGAKTIEAAKKNDEGTVWTITLPESALADEGSINVMFQAWNAAGVQAKGENGDHAFGINIIVKLNDDPSAIKNIIATLGEDAPVYTTAGARINANMMKSGNVYIINGKKMMVK